MCDLSRVACNEIFVDIVQICFLRKNSKVGVIALMQRVYDELKHSPHWYGQPLFSRPHMKLVCSTAEYFDLKYMRQLWYTVRQIQTVVTSYIYIYKVSVSTVWSAKEYYHYFTINVTEVFYVSILSAGLFEKKYFSYCKSSLLYNRNKRIH